MVSCFPEMVLATSPPLSASHCADYFCVKGSLKALVKLLLLQSACLDHWSLGSFTRMQCRENQTNKALLLYSV